MDISCQLSWFRLMKRIQLGFDVLMKLQNVQKHTTLMFICFNVFDSLFCTAKREFQIFHVIFNVIRVRRIRV